MATSTAPVGVSSGIDDMFSRLRIEPRRETLAPSPEYSSGRSGGVWRVLAPRDGMVVGAAYDGSAKVATLSDSEPLNLRDMRVLPGPHSGSVLSIAKLGPHMFATGSSNGTMCFWNTADGTFRKSFKEPSAPGQRSTGHYSMAPCRKEDRNVIATGACQRPQRHKGAWNHDVKIWNPNTNELEAQLSGHVGGISAIVPLTEGTRIATSSGDRTIRVWNLTRPPKTAEERQLRGHGDYIYGLARLGPDQLVSGSRDKTVRIWHPERGEQIGLLANDRGTAHESTVYDVATHGDLVLSGGRDGMARLWDARSEQRVTTLNPDDGFIYGVGFAPAGHTVIAGTSGKFPEGGEREDNAHIVSWDLRASSHVV